MGLPDATLKILDGSLGLELPANAGVHAIVGACAGGTANTVVSFTSRAALLAALVGGPAMEAAAYSIQQAGGPVLVVPATITTAGSAGAVTQTGTGPALTLPVLSAVFAVGTAPPALTLTGTPANFFALVVVITTTGVLGTSQFKASLDGGTTFTAIAATAATVALTGAGAGVTLNFPAGTYTNDNVYSAQSSVPYDGYELLVRIVGGGALATATFQYALDGNNPTASGGPTWSAVFLTPGASAPTYVVPGTGITLTFAAGTYAAATTYASTCVAPSYSNAAMAVAVTALLAQPTLFDFVHVVGQSASVALSYAQAVALDASMSGAATSFRYTFGLSECASDTDANTLAAFTNLSSVRVGVAAGFARLISASVGATGGMTLSRSIAWIAAARASAVKPATDVAQVDLGAVSGVVSLSRDEQVTPGLDAGRFVTMRTIIGKQGFYITNGRLMAPNGSDYIYFHYRRIMDRACTISRGDALNFLNKTLDTNQTTGTLDEVQARSIESAINSDLSNQLVKATPRQLTKVSIQVGRVNTITQDSTLFITISLQPLGYAKFINETIGFVASTPAS